MRYASSLVGLIALTAIAAACGGSSTTPGAGPPPDPSTGIMVFPSDRRVSRNTGGADARYPEVACWDQKVYVIWQDGREDAKNIFFNRSTDGGVTWEPTDVQVDHPGEVINEAWDLAIACEDDLVVVVWSDDRNGDEDIYLNRSVNGGVTWQSSDTRLDTDVPGAAISGLPALAVTDGAVYVAWTENRTATNSIHFSASHDGGVSWPVSDVPIDEDIAGTYTSWIPSVAAIGPDVCVTWKDDRNNILSSNFDAYARTSGDGGATWDPIALVNTNTPGSASVSSPSIGRDGPTRVYAAWSDDRVGGTAGPLNHVYFNRSTDGGRSWGSTDVPLTQGTTASGGHHPSLCAWETNVLTVWGRTNPGVGTGVSVLCRRSLDAGVTWGPEEGNAPTPPGLISSLVGPVCTCWQDYVFVAWLDNRASTTMDVYLNYATWTQPFSVADLKLNTPTTTTTDVGQPVLCASPDATYVVWYDDRDGYDAVFMNSAHR